MSSTIQWSTAKILKPFDNFESVYQGISALRPIAFPGTFDPMVVAGVAGFNSTLISGFPVPLGARLLFWFPLCFFGYEVPRLYRFQLLFRLRSIEDHNDSIQLLNRDPKSQIQYHLQRREMGIPDAPGGPDLAIIPACAQSIAFVQQEPAGDKANTTTNLRGNFIVPDGELIGDGATNSPAPLDPAGDPATMTQGVFPAATGDTPGGPVYYPYVCDAVGDEVIILARRQIIDDPDNDTWDFDDVTKDLAFSTTFGTDDGTRSPLQTSGIFLLTGTP